ncbi:MAG TPA: tetratricopeptide repeat protein [Euryarchaeota archaeon]|nr:tetratricopeptide repeat protein [Euryarchaeota archaeon]
MSESTNTGNRWMQVYSLYGKGYAHYRMNQMERAKECANKGMEVSVEIGNAETTADLHKLLGMVAVKEEDFGTSFDHFEDALKIALGGGMARIAAETQTEYALLLARTGKKEDAVKYLDTAKKMYLDCELDYRASKLDDYYEQVNNS